MYCRKKEELPIVYWEVKEELHQGAPTITASFKTQLRYPWVKVNCVLALKLITFSFAFHKDETLQKRRLLKKRNQTQD